MGRGFESPHLHQSRRSLACGFSYLDHGRGAAGSRWGRRCLRPGSRVDRLQPLREPIRELLEQAVADATAQGAADPDPERLAAAPILRLTPFVEQMGMPAGIRKEFWWEREWRHPGDLRFAPADIVVVFAP